MIRFAKLLTQGTPSPEAFAAYAAEVGPEDAIAARALLSGQRPKRLLTPTELLALVAEETQTPPFLLEACAKVTQDTAELAALLLPPATGPAPTLTQTLAILTIREACLPLARSLPPEARLILNRLATGTFRTKLQTPAPAEHRPGTCLAILTLLDPSGPEATFALPQGNTLIPLTRLKLTLPETAQILTWAKAHTTDRFGPLRQVAPTQIFELAYEGQTPNPRRKCGFDLVAPRLLAWHPSLTPDRATQLNALK